jgi:hypothetical protein
MANLSLPINKIDPVFFADRRKKLPKRARVILVSTSLEHYPVFPQGDGGRWERKWFKEGAVEQGLIKEGLIGWACRKPV